jgi:hypothetical protein
LRANSNGHRLIPPTFRSSCGTALADRLIFSGEQDLAAVGAGPYAVGQVLADEI